jgi:hypothetical protein
MFNPLATNHKIQRNIGISKKIKDANKKDFFTAFFLIANALCRCCWSITTQDNRDMLIGIQNVSINFVSKILRILNHWFIQLIKFNVPHVSEITRGIINRHIKNINIALMISIASDERKPLIIAKDNIINHKIIVNNDFSIHVI